MVEVINTSEINMHEPQKKEKPQPGPPRRTVLVMGTVNRKGQMLQLTPLQLVLWLTAHGTKPRGPVS